MKTWRSSIVVLLAAALVVSSEEPQEQEEEEVLVLEGKTKRQIYYPFNDYDISYESAREPPHEPQADSTGHLPVAPQYPSDPYQAPVYEPAAPVYEPPVPVYDPPAPSYKPEPVYRPQPAYKPQPTYKPKPAYRPKPVYQEPSYHEPGPRPYKNENTIPGEPGVDYPVYHEIPYTKFTCDDVPYRPGMYANPEAGCQLYHVCHDNRYGHKGAEFLCTNGTLFNQETFNCDWWYNVDCSKATSFYDLNTDPEHNPYYQKPYEGPLHIPADSYHPDPYQKPEPYQPPKPAYRPPTHRPSYGF